MSENFGKSAVNWKVTEELLKSIWEKEKKRKSKIRLNFKKIWEFCFVLEEFDLSLNGLNVRIEKFEKTHNGFFKKRWMIYNNCVRNCRKLMTKKITINWKTSMYNNFEFSTHELRVTWSVDENHRNGQNRMAEMKRNFLSVFQL